MSILRLCAVFSQLLIGFTSTNTLLLLTPINVLNDPTFPHFPYYMYKVNIRTFIARDKWVKTNILFVFVTKIYVVAVH